MGRRNDANIDRNRIVPTNRHNLLLLKNSQQLGLEFEVEFAYFVKEDRAAGSRTKTTHRSVRGACKRTFHVTEQLACEEATGNRGTINWNERLAGA